jgi:hypothetical protein
LAATQAGPRLGELAAKAAVGTRRAALRSKVAAAMGNDLPAPDMLYKADGLRGRAAEYRRLAAMPGMPGMPHPT